MNDPGTKIWIEMDGYRYKFENGTWSSNERDSEHDVELLNSFTHTPMVHETAIRCVRKVLARAGLTEDAIKEIDHDKETKDDITFGVD